MSRWYDCPLCVGYCEELVEDGKNVCFWCGEEVWFEPAPQHLKERLYKAGIWIEEVVCINDDDDKIAMNPAFSSQEQYDTWIEWNSIRIGAVCDQISALLGIKQKDDHGCGC